MEIIEQADGLDIRDENGESENVFTIINMEPTVVLRSAHQFLKRKHNPYVFFTKVVQ